MAETQTPLINGYHPSWAQAEVVIDGDRYQGIKSLNYTFPVAKTKVRGTNQLPIGRTTGQADFTGDMEMYVLTFKALVARLGDGFANAVFDIDVSWRGQPDDNLSTVELIGATFSEVGGGGADGNDAVTVKLKLDFMNAKIDGVWIVPPIDNTGATG